MKILVTGGTGFVGSHSVAALRADGHDVRLLVRSLDRVAPALDPLGVHDVDAVEGDCSDADAVGRALSGCDGVLHCANVFRWAPRLQGELVRSNRAATEHVLRQAVHAGLDPVVHVSSYAALAPSDTPLGTQSPPRAPGRGYAASKGVTERMARRLQDEGAPVVISYPGAVLGPHDPYFGDSNGLICTLASSPRPPGFGSIACVDVRDVAAVHTAVMVPGRGPRRFMVTGHDIAVRELAVRVATIAGTSSRPMTLPPPVARGLGRVMDAFDKLPGVSVPVGSGAVSLLLEYHGASTESLSELGLGVRPLDDTLRDTVAWLRQAGHLPDRTPVSA
jgi:nucleoside-diphosphate-sugar epimerase